MDLSSRVVWDTMLGSQVLEQGEPAGLDAAAGRAGLEGGGKVGAEELKAWLRREGYPPGRYDLVPWSLMEGYARQDAVVTLRLWLHQQQVLGELAGDLEEGNEEEESKNRKARRLIEEQVQLMKALYAMECRGVGYDAEESLRAAALIEAEAQRVEEQWKALTGGLGVKPRDAQRWFWTVQKCQPVINEKTERPSLDEEVTREYEKAGVPGAAEWREMSRLRRAVSMWYRGYPALIGADGRLRPSYRQGHVRSGRMSVERVQLQALPKYDKAVGVRGPDGEEVPDVRELICARPGAELWNLDLSQAELRVAARYAGCETMLEMLRGGADLHGETCTALFGKRPGEEGWKAARDIAKRLTFGSIFQIGAKTFRETLKTLADVDMPLGECYRLVQRWRDTYPEFGVAYRRAERAAEARKRVRLLPGTEWEVESWMGGPRDFAHTAWNRIVQGSLARFLQLWLIEVEKQKPGLMVLTVHDSLLLDVGGADGAGGRGVARDENGVPLVVQEVRQMGREMATRMFMRNARWPEETLEMLVDVDRWKSYDKVAADNDQYEGVKKRAAA